MKPQVPTPIPGYRKGSLVSTGSVYARSTRGLRKRKFCFIKLSPRLVRFALGAVEGALAGFMVKEISP